VPEIAAIFKASYTTPRDTITSNGTYGPFVPISQDG
jgi:hypothetical protein